MNSMNSIEIFDVIQSAESLRIGMEINQDGWYAVVVLHGTSTPVYLDLDVTENLHTARALLTSPSVQLAVHDLDGFARAAWAVLGVPAEGFADRVLDSLTLLRIISPSLGYSTAEDWIGAAVRRMEASDPGLYRSMAEGMVAEVATPDGQEIEPRPGQKPAATVGVNATTALWLSIHLVRAILRLPGGQEMIRTEHRLALQVMQMSLRGMRVDVEYATNLDERLAAEADAALATCEQWGLNSPGADHQLAAVLNAVGVDVPSGGLSYNTLEAIEHELAEAALRFRRAEKHRSYTRALLSDRGTDDRIHATIRPQAARTARMSVSAPPLQQIPKRGGAEIRRCLVAGPGEVVISADYDQVELRVLAALADVKAMKEAIAAGIDLHTQTACLLYDVIEPNEEQRRVAKAANFLTVYGGGAERLAEQADIEVEQANSVLDEFDIAYPEIRTYGDQIRADAARLGYVHVPTSGRRIPVDKERVATTALNYAVQSSARDVLVGGINRAFEAGIGHHLVLPIHDELVAVCPEEIADDVLARLVGAMAVRIKDVLITASGNILGYSWK
ncbi:DNA polymerase A family protein [Leucobacter aridicollis]